MKSFPILIIALVTAFALSGSEAVAKKKRVAKATKKVTKSRRACYNGIPNRAYYCTEYKDFSESALRPIKKACDVSISGKKPPKGQFYGWKKGRCSKKRTLTRCTTVSGRLNTYYYRFKGKKKKFIIEDAKEVCKELKGKFKVVKKRQKKSKRKRS